MSLLARWVSAGFAFFSAILILGTNSGLAEVLVQQVQIDAKVVELKQTVSSDMGIDFEKLATKLAQLPGVDAELSSPQSTSVGIGATPSADSLRQLFVFDDESEAPPRPTLTSIFTPRQSQIIIDTILKEKAGKILDSPVINLSSGDSGAMRVPETNIRLVFTPVISDDRTGIQFSINPEIPGLEGEPPMNATVGTGRSQVPLLGDIPLIGGLFRSRADEKMRRDLLIFVTPRIRDALGGGGYRDDDPVKVEAGGTGETIGSVANLKIQNMTDGALTFVIPPLILESRSQENQDYACTGGNTVKLAPRETETVPMSGVCINRNKPPVGKGVTGDLVINTGDKSVRQNSECHNSASETDEILRLITPKFECVEQLQKEGLLKDLPYADKREQRNVLIQWSVWSDSRISQMTETPPATKEDLQKVAYKQVEEKGRMTPATKKKVDEGLDKLFEKVELTTEKAKELEDPAATPEEPANSSIAASPEEISS